MLNFDKDAIFSRMLPVYDQPEVEGNYEEKKMLRYDRYGPVGNFPKKRPRTEKGKDVNFSFFPEGGNLIQGIPSRVAFEATDENGIPIEVTGVVIDGAKQELCRFSTLREGKGVFAYIPGDSKQKAVAEVEYSGKKYQFDLPASLSQGITMETDNLSDPDNIWITLRRSGNTTGEFGLVVLSGGNLQSYSYINFTDDKKELRFKVDKTEFPSGVSQVVLFDDKGKIICDRLIFTGGNNFLDISVKTNKPLYLPFELVEMEFSVSDSESNPVNTTFSLSVRDGMNEVEYKHNILTDLLLMSEIKGYVRNPSYYFEKHDDTRRAALDVLLMVQGWRRYSWNQMAGLEDLQLKYTAEQGIETNGTVVSIVRERPKADVKVDLLLKQKVEEDTDEEPNVFTDTFVTDEQGRFSFVSDVPGMWSMILSITEKGKRKDHMMLLDRVFSPDPKEYRYSDLQVNIADENNKSIVEGEISDVTEEETEDWASFFAAYEDSLSKLGITDKVHVLPEVTVRARRSAATDVAHNRSTSVAYYDVVSEMDNIYDRGTYIGDDIHDMLVNTNKKFFTIGRSEYLGYDNVRAKWVLFVVNYEPVLLDPDDNDNNGNYFHYKGLKLSAIKSIYINEDPEVIVQYIEVSRIAKNKPNYTPQWLADNSFGCVVFIETYPDGKTPNESIKGVRKTWLEGYSSEPKEFYNPDYSNLTTRPDNDYRRTLYWNPSVATDESGVAKINFYNNSRSKSFSISAETVTQQGMIGVNK